MKKWFKNHKKLTRWMIGIGIFTLIIALYWITYWAFTSWRLLPAGENLGKSDWLAFFGSYLSFASALALGGVTVYQNKKAREDSWRNNQDRDLTAYQQEIIKFFEKISEFSDDKLNLRYSNLVITTKNKEAPNVVMQESLYYNMLVSYMRDFEYFIVREVYYFDKQTEMLDSLRKYVNMVGSYKYSHLDMLFLDIDKSSLQGEDFVNRLNNENEQLTKSFNEFVKNCNLYLGEINAFRFDLVDECMKVKYLKSRYQEMIVKKVNNDQEELKEKNNG